MKRISELKSLLCGVLLLFSLSWISAAGDFVLVKNGAPQAVIIKNRKVQRAQDFLLLETAKCGVKMSLADSAKNGHKIVFEVKENVPLEQEDVFTIDFPDPATMKITCTRTSARWAANHLMETAFGVRWFFPHLKEYGNEINDYPKAVNISVKAEKYVQKPYSFYLDREMVWRFGNWTANWGNQRRMVENHWIAIDAFPVWKYAPDQSWPQEIMPVWNGKKLKLPKPKKLPLPKNPYLARAAAAPNPSGLNYFNGWNPCFSHPKSAEIAAANILEELERNPNRKKFILSVNDNGGFCQCDACRKAVSGKRNFSGYPDYSDLYWTWMNKVAETVSQKYPDVLFSASAYREVMNPPSFRLHPRIVPKFAFDIYAMTDPKVREVRLAQLKTWSERSSQLLLYDYDYGKGAFLFPRLSVRLHAEMVKNFHHDFNARGLSTEALVLPFDGPKYYVMYRLLRDINADPEKLADEWYRGVVGTKAAPALQKYFQFWEDYWTGPDIRRTQWYRSVTNIYMQLGERPTHTFALKRGDMKKLRTLMTEVVEKAETQQQKRRALVFMKYFEYAEAAAQALFSELIPPEGKLNSTADAVELLRQVPAAIEAEKRFRDHPYNSRKESISSSMLLNIGLVMPFIKETEVRKELKQLENDSRLPATLRGQIKIWLGFKAENRIENGSFEQDAVPLRPLWMRKLNGKRDSSRASDGKYSFRTRNGYYLVNPKIEPGKTYLFLCDVFIERGSNEGRFRINLAPSSGRIPRDWIRKENVLTGGQWNTYSMVVSHPSADNLQIQIGLRNFESTEPVWLDNLRFYCLDEFITLEKHKKSTQGEQNMNLKKSKIAASVAAVAACAVMSAGDLPKELENLPKEEIVDISKNIYGPKADDPESPTGKAAVYVPAENAKNYGGIGMGVRNRKQKEVVGFSRPKPLDEKYRWYKIKRRNKDVEYRGGAYNTRLYLENETIGAWVPKDITGKYDCWALVKAQGPFYVQGSTKENKLFLARVLLVPVK